MSVSPVGEVVEVTFDGECFRCGRRRDVRFVLPDRVGAPPGSAYRFSFPEDDASGVIDPGEWYGVAQAYGAIAAQAVEQLGDRHEAWADPAVREDMVSLLARSAAAIEEVERFLSPDAATVPADAFVTLGGREVWRASPDSFAAETLADERTDRWRRLQTFLAQHSEPA